MHGAGPSITRARHGSPLSNASRSSFWDVDSPLQELLHPALATEAIFTFALALVALNSATARRRAAGEPGKFTAPRPGGAATK